MTPKSVCRILSPCVLAAVLFLASGSLARPDPVSKGHAFSLQAPPIGSVARADESAVASQIEDEAGISAYWQAPPPILLEYARDAFRTIEAETADYILGSVPVPDNPESEDVHVYVHRDGWILAYYTVVEPAVKILDWPGYHNSGHTDFTTKLESAIAVVASAAGISPVGSASYYDFRFPDATDLVLVGDWVCGNDYGQADTFQVRLPNGLNYYERSWSLGATYDEDDYSHSTIPHDLAWYKLDGATLEHFTISRDYHPDWQTTYATFSPIQLLPDGFREIEVWANGGADAYGMRYVYAYGGLAVVYGVTQ